MDYITGAGVRTDKQCLPNTRVGIIEEIADWVMDSSNDVSRVFFLCGQAGSGKSSIAHSVGLQFRKTGQLGSFFCFDRKHSANRTPEKVLLTVAHDLGVWNRELGSTLAAI